MTDVIILKAVLSSFLWSIVWICRFRVIDAPVNTKNLMIAFAPWILIVLYFMLFWWG